MTVPVEVAQLVAYARSCRGPWLAAQCGDRDPQVLELAQIYQQVIGGEE